MLAPGADPLRILHLSDLHLTSAQRRKRDWIRRLDRLDPDLVVVTGDFLAGMDAIGPVLAALEPLLERPGAFVPGNNDYYAPRFKNPLRYFVPERNRDLRRQAALVAVRRRAGRRRLGRPHQPPRHPQGRRPGHRAGRHGRPAPRPRPVRPGSGPADPTADLRLGRRPTPPSPGSSTRSPPTATSWCWPATPTAASSACPASARSSPTAASTAAGCAGCPAGATAWLHVSAGLGTSPYAPVRFCCPPEATLLTLVPAPPLDSTCAPSGCGAAW